MPLGTFFRSTAKMIKELAPLAAGVAGYLAREAITTVRQLDSSALKDSIKQDISTIASGVNVTIIFVTSYPLLTNLIHNRDYIKNFHPGESTILIAGVLLTVGTAMYVLKEFSVEQHTLSAGLSASASGLFANLTDHFLNKTIDAYAQLEMEEANQNYFRRMP